jgi:hypothetical protein
MAGNDPITPARQDAMTSSGPDTRNMGAAIAGIFSRLRIEEGRAILMQTSYYCYVFGYLIFKAILVNGQDWFERAF